MQQVLIGSLRTNFADAPRSAVAPRVQAVEVGLRDAAYVADQVRCIVAQWVAAGQSGADFHAAEFLPVDLEACHFLGCQARAQCVAAKSRAIVHALVEALAVVVRNIDQRGQCGDRIFQ